MAKNKADQAKIQEAIEKEEKPKSAFSFAPSSTNGDGESKPAFSFGIAKEQSEKEKRRKRREEREERRNNFSNSFCSCYIGIHRTRSGSETAWSFNCNERPEIESVRVCRRVKT